MRVFLGTQIKTAAIVIALLLSLGVSASGWVLAHPTSQSYLLLEQEGETLQFRWLIAPEDLAGSRLFKDGNADFGEKQILAAQARIETALLSRLRVSSRERIPLRTMTGFGFTRDRYLELGFRFDFETSPVELTIGQDLSAFFGHPHLIQVTRIGFPESKEVVIGPRDQDDSVTLQLYPPLTVEAPTRVLQEGMKALARHPDLLFSGLALLFLGSGRLLLWVIFYFLVQGAGMICTAFFDLPAPGVEILAPLLMAYVGAEKLFIGNRHLLVGVVVLMAFVQGIHAGIVYGGSGVPGIGSSVQGTAIFVLLLLAVQLLAIGIVSRVSSRSEEESTGKMFVAGTLLVSGLLLAGKGLVFG